jgi:hypothetical protein
MIWRFCKEKIAEDLAKKRNKWLGVTQGKQQ